MKVLYKQVCRFGSDLSSVSTGAEKKPSKAIIRYNSNVDVSSCEPARNIRFLRPPRDFDGLKASENVFSRLVENHRNQSRIVYWPSTEALCSDFQEIKRRADDFDLSNVDLVSSETRRRSKVFLSLLSTKTDYLVQLRALISLWGVDFRARYQDPEIKACFRQLFQLVLGETKSEEMAIKKLQDAISLYQRKNFLYKFEAPVLASFRGLQGGSGADYEKNLVSLRYMVKAQRDTLEYLLECVSEPGFFDEIYREPNFFEGFVFSAAKFSKKTGDIAISFYLRAQEKASDFLVYLMSGRSPFIE